MQGPQSNWLILLPHIPPQPSSLRVRVWRRLQQLGAVAVKNAAYALPNTEAALEDFQWLAQEIVDSGGGVMLLEANGLAGADEEIRDLFRSERSRDYQKLCDDADGLASQCREEKDLTPRVNYRRPPSHPPAPRTTFPDSKPRFFRNSRRG